MGAFSADSTPPTNLEDSPSSRSFFARLGIPLRSRSARNVAEFHINTAEPHRKYAAGDHVKGAVILTIIKPIRITHLTVALHGYVRVFKGPNNSGSDSPVNPANIPTGSTSQCRYNGNGHASLFSDEQVLSADGRLDPGKYEFNFELVFPEKVLPSSIDFERGTVSYVITASLTRPTSISPVTACERKVYLVEQVDVGLLEAPRARTIFLEPISKRARRRRLTAVEKSSATTPDAAEPPLDLDSTRPNENSTEGSLSVIADETTPHDAQVNSRSTIHSDMRSISGESAISGSTGLSRGGDASHGPTSVTSQSRIPGMDERTITATIEMLKGGCLPGDVVTIKTSVQHIKRIKSMHGVIVTLYRQGRIDSAPPLSLFRNGRLSKEDKKRLEKDEYYPRSRTGLGGLSLSSAGSCSVFRKDLTQAFSPLILDPKTLTASIKTLVRVPEDVFPSIKGVPGDMISFKYQLEVLVDLGGKLASQIQVGPTTSSGNIVVGASGHSGGGGGPFDGSVGQVTSFGSNIIDTDRLRREKGVISVVFEIIVGTSDSSRQKVRGAVRAPPVVYTQQIHESELHNDGAKGGAQNGYGDEEDEGVGQDEYQDDFRPFPPEPVLQYPYWRPPEPPRPLAPFYVPHPQVPDEAALSEKERIRRAEQQLLPSEPPDIATAPKPAEDEENIYDAEDPPPRLAPDTPQELPPRHGEEAPSAPTLEDLTAAAGPHARADDDKQELERRRLLQEASAPPVFPDDYDGGGGAGSAGPSASAPPASAPWEVGAEPSAPVLSDEERYGEQFAYSAAPGANRAVEQLPKYER